MYPTNDTVDEWQPPEVNNLVLAPRRRSIIREEAEDGTFQEKPAPLGQWNQGSLCPCKNPSIMLYSIACCCCAMGDVGCYVRENWMCYPAYCMCAFCPCCVGETRELMAEKYNLPISEWEPDTFGWCLVKFIGLKLMCVASVCLVPCCHVAQMRAEVAYRQHGAATVFPCCCFRCGGGAGPPEDSADTSRRDGDYPRDSDEQRTPPPKKKEVTLDYPRAGGKADEEDEPVFVKKKKKEEAPVLDYPKAGRTDSLEETLEYYAPPVVPKKKGPVLDYPKAGRKDSYEESTEVIAPPAPADYPR